MLLYAINCLDDDIKINMFEEYTYMDMSWKVEVPFSEKVLAVLV